MSRNKKNIIKHIFILVGVAAVLSLGIIYPFLSGEYDRLAMPLSILIQAFGAIGLLLSVVGLLWLIMPKKQYLHAKVALYLSTFVFVLLGFIGFLSAGKIFGILIIVIWVILFRYFKAKLRNSKEMPQNTYSATPIYLIGLPIFLLIFQLIIAKPITEWSKKRAIAQANAYINDINQFQSTYNHYPKSLQAIYKDYYPRVVGIEKYHYSPSGASYNLYFEQPRFLFDVIGTRECVVYNPKDEHRVYSHTSWFLLLSPEALENSQGWYASGKTGHLHWKYFLFD